MIYNFRQYSSQELVHVVYAVHYILFTKTLNCLVHHSLMTVLYKADEFLRPETFESLLNFREGQLDWVGLRVVRDIVNPLEALS